MKNRQIKRFLSIGLAAVLAVGLLAGCGSKGDKQADDKKEAKDASFTWWIFQTDGAGEFYEDYNDSPVVQWIESQYWDSENGGIGDEESGRKLDFSYLVPISGSEHENFNTMIGTGEYPEIIDAVISPDSPQALHDSGIAMDITEYVEKYMPNYLAYLDKYPELKPLVQVKEDDGSIHYYALYALQEGTADPWQGTCYRRDWVVKYAEPTEYVWDWESDYVKENGHPAVTPLVKAQKENNLEGWKKNEVKAFEADYEADTETGYDDNVIFPSGTKNPLTISDWEWMFEAFTKALEIRGWTEDSSAYCTTVYYSGYMSTGDLVSSFGGGTGQYYVNDGEVSFDGNSENFKTYLECLNTWYNNGWLDKEFNTRANDMFFQINSAGVAQGKVGLWDGMSSMLGTVIRQTCQYAEDAQDAYVMGAALPINDVYGGEDQMYKEPDALFQSSRKGGSTVITTKAEGKDLETLFTFFDWTYTMEGGMTMYSGLNEEQYASAKLDPDLYKEYDLKCAYTTSEDENGKTIYKRNVESSNPLVNALCAMRMVVGRNPSRTDTYFVDAGVPALQREAFAEWSRYLNTGNTSDYTGLLSVEESDAYNKVNTAVTEYQKQSVPGVIKGEMSWEDYVKGMESINPESAVEYLQKYVDLANTVRTQE